MNCNYSYKKTNTYGVRTYYKDWTRLICIISELKNLF